MVHFKKIYRHLLYIAIFLLATPSPSVSDDEVTLQLRWDHQFQFAGYYAAKWMGYYSAAGIDATILPAVTKDKVILSATDEVAKGRAHFGIGAADILVARDKGYDLVVTASIFQESAANFYAREDTLFIKPAHLINLRISRIINDLLDVEFQAMLKLQNISDNDIISVQHQPGIDHLLSRETDVIPGYSITIPYIAKTKGIKLKTLKPSTHGVRFYGDSLFTTAHLAKEQPDLTRRFTEASIQGWDYAVKHREEIAERICSELPRSTPIENCLEFNLFQSERVTELLHQEIIPIGHINHERWQSMHDTLREAGLSNKKPLVLNEFLLDPHQILHVKKQRQLEMIIYAIGFLLLAIVITIFFVGALRRTVRKKTAELNNANLILKESDQRLRQISEATFEGICLSHNGVIIDANEQLAKLTGYPYQEIISRNLESILAPEYIEIFRKNVETNFTAPYEVICIKKDGSRFYAEGRGRNIRYKGKMVRESVIRDITEKKLIHQALLNIQHELSTVFDNTPLLMMLIDEQHHIRKINRFASHIFQMDNNEVIGRPSGQAFHCIHRKDSPRGCGFGPTCDVCTFRQAIDNTFKTQQPQEDIETLFTTEFKGVVTHYSMLLSTVPILIADEQMILVCAQDISKRKTMEQQLRQAYKMEAIGTLAGGIAHDFNNILSLVVGYAEMAQDDVHSPDECMESLDNLLNSADKARGLVQQILAFSRQTDVERIPLKPSTLIKEWLKMLRSTLPTTIEIKQNIDPDCGLIHADASQLQQIFMNLCTNAFHAMEKTGGVLEVKLLKTSIDHKADPDHLYSDLGAGKYMKLAVSDTGPGIQHAILDKIFDPYFTTKELGKGTGMGLAIVHSIVKDYGGTIKVFSKEKKNSGTTFHVLLPTMESEEKSPATDKQPGIRGGSEKILVVDDDPEILLITERILSRLGYHVSTMLDGQQALKIITGEENTFDLLITDQTMSTITGADLTRRIRKAEISIPIVLCTGYSSMISEEEAQTLGVTAFAYKPLQKRELALLIRRVLDEDQESKRSTESAKHLE